MDTEQSTDSPLSEAIDRLKVLIAIAERRCQAYLDQVAELPDRSVESNMARWYLSHEKARVGGLRDALQAITGKGDVP